MTREEFETALQQDGFPPPVLVERPADTRLEEHTHPFEACALILDGWIELEVAGVVTRYTPGQVFQLPANRAHAERYGPNGVRYLSGRR